MARWTAPPSAQVTAVRMPAVRSWHPSARRLAGSPSGRSDAVRARVVVAGKVHDVYTNAPTARALLSAMGIKPDGDDRVLPSPSTPISAGRLVRVVPVERRIRRVTSRIPFTTYTTYSSSIPPGQSRVVRPGANGRFVRIFREKVVGGRVVQRRQVGQRVAMEAQPEHVVVGRTASTPSASVTPTWRWP